MIKSCHCKSHILYIVLNRSKNYEPFFFANYLIQLATEFHILYEKEKFITEDKKISSYKITIVKSIQTIIKNGLNAFGVEVVERM